MERIPHELRQAFAFFFAHAGHQEGYRAHGALQLARAEQQARATGRVASWEPEQEPDLSWMDDAERQKDHEVETCVIYRPCANCGHLEVIASLGNIVDADAPYRRVVEAELYAECAA
jgi:hypothetical protein